LIGTSSIDSSEKVSALLKRNKIKHEVLNAKQHQREAEIIANAGAPGAVTIATNMAGRGTDIVLGGKPLEDITEKEKAVWKEKHDAVIKAGGLHIIGTERNESRRVDNQLRGRSGRQGDIGSTRFYLSLEDGLMKIFASEKTASMMKKLGMKEGEALEHSWLNRTIENAQRKVEGMHYDARKHLLEYDDVANDQRKVIYQLRDDLMGTEDIKDRYDTIREKVIGELFEEYISPQMLEEDWDIGGLESALKAEYGLYISLQKSIDNGLDVDEILGVVLQGLVDSHDAKEAVVGAATMRTFEKAVMLRALDHYWKEHLAVMDHLRQSVNLRGYAQKNPVQEFKRESFTMFTSLLETINTEMVKALCAVSVDQKRDSTEAIANARPPTKTNAKQVQNTTKTKPAQAPNKAKKIGRNDPCPCGSGKKYKRCHG
jgi:preprotein translocase subunit SecA